MSLLLELEFQDADFVRLQTAWREIVKRHRLLRSYVDNTQLTEVADASYEIKLYDLSLQPLDKTRAVQNKLRAAEPLSSAKWPWFSVRATRYSTGNIRLYFAAAEDMLSASQIYYLLRELLALYQNSELPIHSLTLEKPSETTPINQHAFTLRYTHLYGRLEHHTLKNLRERSIEHNIALPVVLLNAFKNELDRQNYQYPVYMTLANRFPFFPFMYDRACFATAVAGCAINDIYSGKFVDNCQKIDKQLRQESLKITEKTVTNELLSLPHSLDALSLFSCSIEQDLPTGPLFAKMPDIIYCNFALPTIDIDYAVWEQNGQLLYRWSYVKALPSIDSNLDGSLLRNAMLEYPELQEITADNETAKLKRTKALKAASLVLAGTAGATSAKGMTKKKDKKAAPVGITESIKQASESNNVLQQSAGDYGNAITALADPADVTKSDPWQEEKDSAQQDQSDNNGQDTDEQITNNQINDNYSANLAKLGGAGAAVGLLAAAIDALKNADKEPTPAAQAPTPEAVQTMNSDETEQAFADYSKKVLQMHRAPSTADLAQQDICAQFTNTAGELGPNVTQVQTELTEMGGTIDQVSADISKGDLKSAAAGLDKLSGDHAGLVNKMAAQGIPGSADELPINQQASAIYKLSDSLNEGNNPETLEKLNENVDLLDTSITEYEDQFNQQSTGTQDKLAAQLNSGAENIKSQPEFQALQSKTETVKNLGQEVAQYDCATIIETQSKEKIEQLHKEAEELRQQIPQPVNLVDEHIAAVQEKASAVQAKADSLKQSSGDNSINFEDPGLQASISELNTSADELANTVQGQCPICASKSPSLPAVPTCGHNHADVLNMTNPFNMPQMKLAASLNILEGLNLNLPVVDKIKGLKDRLQAMNPIPEVPNVTNPYSVLKSAVSATLTRVESQTTNLANCPNYPDDIRQKLADTQSSLEDSQQKLQALIEQDSSGSTNDKFTALQEQMKEQMRGQKDTAISEAQAKQQQMLAALQAEAMAKVTSSVACWRSMNMPSVGAGKPDEILVTMFKCKCPMSAGGPMPMPVKPGGLDINNKPALIVNGIPLTQPMGACQHSMLWIKPAPPPPCIGTFNVAGGSTMSSNMGMPIGTKSTTQVICLATGTKAQIIDTGQDPSSAVTTS